MAPLIAILDIQLYAATLRYHVHAMVTLVILGFP